MNTLLFGAIANIILAGVVGYIVGRIDEQKRQAKIWERDWKQINGKITELEELAKDERARAGIKSGKEAYLIN